VAFIVKGILLGYSGCPGLKILGQQRAGRTRATHFLLCLMGLEALALAITSLEPQPRKSSQEDELTVPLLMSHIQQKWVARKTLFSENTLS
jgi:hypothetical protein